MLCAGCTDGCIDPPTPQSPLFLDGLKCDCGGAGCAECMGRGVAMVACCPRELVTEDIRRGIKLAYFAGERNLWPVTGGAMDQTRMGLEFFEIVWNDQAELNKPNGNQKT